MLVGLLPAARGDGFTPVKGTGFVLKFLELRSN